MKYICLGYYDKSKNDAMTEAEKDAMFDACFIYDDHLRADGHWAVGEALQPAETALTVYWKNGKVATTDGPYVETKEQLGGIGILEARDMNHAHQIVSQHPSLKYGAIFEIRPVGDLSEIRKASENRRQKSAQTKGVIEAALRESRGRVFGRSGAADKLGIPRSTLESKIRSLKIDKNRFKSSTDK